MATCKLSVVWLQSHHLPYSKASNQLQLEYLIPELWWPYPGTENLETESTSQLLHDTIWIILGLDPPESGSIGSTI
jgi:hypothetical protein